MNDISSDGFDNSKETQDKIKRVLIERDIHCPINNMNLCDSRCALLFVMKSKEMNSSVEGREDLIPICGIAKFLLNIFSLQESPSSVIKGSRVRIPL